MHVFQKMRKNGGHQARCENPPTLKFKSTSLQCYLYSIFMGIGGIMENCHSKQIKKELWKNIKEKQSNVHLKFKKQFKKCFSQVLCVALNFLSLCRRILNSKHISLNCTTLVNLLWYHTEPKPRNGSQSWSQSFLTARTEPKPKPKPGFF